MIHHQHKPRRACLCSCLFANQDQPQCRMLGHHRGAELSGPSNQENAFGCCTTAPVIVERSDARRRHNHNRSTVYASLHQRSARWAPFVRRTGEKVRRIPPRSRYSMVFLTWLWSDVFHRLFELHIAQQASEPRYISNRHPSAHSTALRQGSSHQFILGMDDYPPSRSPSSAVRCHHHFFPAGSSDWDSCQTPGSSALHRATCRPEKNSQKNSASLTPRLTDRCTGSSPHVDHGLLSKIPHRLLQSISD